MYVKQAAAAHNNNVLIDQIITCLFTEGQAR